MANYGKIAHLPRHIRDELNRRIDNGEMGVKLVAWLNTLPEVKEVLKVHFDGSEISEQNLTQWKEFGFRDWRSQQESLALSRDIIANAKELLAQCGGELTESLATVVAVRYADALKKSQEKITDELRDELKTLQGITREVVRLRRSNQMLQRLQLKQQWLQFEQSKYENRKNGSAPRTSVAEPEAMSQEEKDSRLQEWLFPRHLFPERYKDTPEQENGGKQGPETNGTNPN